VQNLPSAPQRLYQAPSRVRIVSTVSCIMPTADRRKFVPAAIRLFLAQDYADKEL
jgi:hypothetical protein